jgi:hypothetical protein
MIDVSIIYDVDNVGHDILLQTPEKKGIVNNCRFNLYNQSNIDQLPKETDAVIVLNSPFTDVKIKTHKQLVFLVSQEAPNARYKWHTHSFKYFSEVYTQWPLKKKNIIPSHGYLTWYIEKEYDELIDINLEKRTNGSVAYIGNKEAILSGQLKRNNFVQALKDGFAEDSKISVDLIGRTYDNPIDNKFDTLYDYQYGLAVENTIVNHYWTEKISDIFLAGCLPFYVGPDNIFDYFPEDSIIKLDIDNLDKSMNIIKESINNNEFEKRKLAINIARNKILNEYNLFYGFSKIINDKLRTISNDKKEEVFLPGNYWGKKLTVLQKIKNKFL